MMKKLILLSFVLMLPAALSAQWRITGCDRADRDDIKLLQIIDLDSATFIYGTLTNDSDSVFRGALDRRTCVYVDDEKYKLIGSVNLPIMDEADSKSVRLDEPGQQVNFVMAFEKFPVGDGFDFIVNGKDRDAWNLYGIHIEEIQPSDVIKTSRFLDAHTVVTQGIFAESGANHRYYIRDKVFIECLATTRSGAKLLSKDDILFTLNIVNESDHGIRFDFEDKVWITGIKKKGNGTADIRTLTKYTPDRYEQFFQSEDYNEAKYATSEGLDFIDSKLISASWRTKSDWEQVGYRMLSSLTEQLMDNNIREYMENHPKQRPIALRTQSIKAGESYSGYVAGKTKNMDVIILHVRMDDYDFQFRWDIRKD